MLSLVIAASLQSSLCFCSRALAHEVHQVSIRAKPVTLFRDARPYPAASPSDQLSCGQSPHTCVRGRADGAPWKFS